MPAVVFAFVLRVPRCSLVGPESAGGTEQQPFAQHYVSSLVEDFHALVAAQPCRVIIRPGEPEALTGADLRVDTAIGIDGQSATKSGQLSWTAEERAGMHQPGFWSHAWILPPVAVPNAAFGVSLSRQIRMLGIDHWRQSMATIGRQVLPSIVTERAWNLTD